MPRPNRLAEKEKIQAWATAHLEPEKVQTAKQFEPFNRADSYSVVALLVGIFLVIIVPPLWLKALLLFGLCIGVGLFVKRSHWTHRRSSVRRYSVASAVVVLLLAVGIPQFIIQWKNEHAHQALQAPPQNSASKVSDDKKDKPCAPMFDFKDSRNIIFENDNFHACGEVVKGQDVKDFKLEHSTIDNKPPQ